MSVISSHAYIACELDTGEQVDVEVQVVNQQNMARRTLFYWAQMYLSSLPKAFDYSQLKPAITINLLAFNMLAESDEVTSSDPHSMYGLYNIKTGHRLNRDLELHFIELPKFTAAAKKPISELTKMERWLSYFANRLTANERNELAMSDAAIAGAMSAARLFIGTPAERHAYINRQLAIMDQKLREESSIAKGKAEERIANLKSIMTGFDCDIDKAMDVLNIPAAERDYYRQATKD